MKELGLTEEQIGLIASLGFASSTISSLIGGPITDKLGRKKTSLIFDIVSWSCSMLIWAFSQNIWFFLAAALVNGMGKIVFVSWTCLVVEDASNDEKVSCFTILNMISLVCGVFTPVAGLLVKLIGLVPALRLLYFLGFISMTAMFFIRNAWVNETALGRRIMEEHGSFTIAQRVADYLDALRYLASKPQAILLLFVNILTNFSIGINIYYAIYIKEKLLIDQSLVSILPGVASIVMIISVVFVIPRLKGKDLVNNLILGFSITTAGWLIFIITPAGNLVQLIVSSAVTALGTSIINPFRDTAWNNSIGEKERAKIFSFGQTLVSLALIPSGMFAASMYRINPVYPFAFIALIFAACLLMAAVVRKKIERQA